MDNEAPDVYPKTRSHQKAKLLSRLLSIAGVGMVLVSTLALSCSRRACSARYCGVARFSSGVDHTLKEPSELSTEPLETLASRWVSPGHVYFVGTPIGNLGDVSARAVEVLSQVDVICAEDTRKTAQLLRMLHIPHKRIISHHEHNEEHSIPGVIDLVKGGKSVAVVSDAGTPGISDPGVGLARALGNEDLPVHPIPGPSAVVSALSVAGFPASEFTFLGFLPVKGTERKEKIALVASTHHTVVLYEAPHRLLRTLDDLAHQSPERYGVCCRELTKMHEEIRRGSLAELLQWAQTCANSEVGIRGEFAIVLGPFSASQKQKWQAARAELELPLSTEKPGVGHEEITEALEDCQSRGIRRSQAAREVAQALGAPRSLVYEISLRIPWDA